MLNVNELLATETAKFSFIKGLIYIAKSDGIIEESEKIFFTQAAENIGLDKSYTYKIKSLIDSNNNDIDLDFDNESQALFLIREAIQLCYVDGQYAETERKAIDNIAKHLDIKTEKVERIERWVEEGMAWSKRGLLLLELED